MPRPSCMLAVAVAVWLVVLVTAEDSSSGSFGAVGTATSDEWTQPTVDDTANTTVFQPAGDFTPKTNGGNEEAAQSALVPPSDGNGGGLSTVAVAVIVSVSAAAAVLGSGMVVCAWRASRREEEAMFVDLGDDRSYTYGRFGDYAAM